ncbi:hypothetical protein [Ralstonia chuxiongensis]|uniref:hypothetical protein n=1 Tax=Ralstonia chuxiongensis TaxID=2957504 RepID=UPI0028F56581|nr:hypothetical protein [Ralstonia chuxiongensis]CAJ0777742.1 hypothetical protein R8510_04404 [Ralstonia chuxiongensis]
MRKNVFDCGAHFPIRSDDAHGLLLVNVEANQSAILYEAALNLEGAIAVLDGQTNGEEISHSLLVAAYQLLVTTKGLVDAAAERGGVNANKGAAQ